MMHPASHTPQLRIGEVAAELGLNLKTIRCHEEIDLLPATWRMPNGYRLYDGADC